MLVTKLEGNKPLGKPRCRRRSNINMDLEEMGYNLWTVLVFIAFFEHGNDII
jgi:hypothetical protein